MRLLIAGFALTIGGCVVLPDRETVEFRFVERDTGRAIGGAPVSVEYIYFATLNVPKAQHGITNAEGRLQLRVAEWSATVVDLSNGWYRFEVDLDPMVTPIRAVAEPEGRAAVALEVVSAE